MPIDGRARDLALGIASALQSGEDVTPAKLAIIEYLFEPDDQNERSERLLSIINANSVMIAFLLDSAPRWYNLGFTLGGLHEHDDDESHIHEVPGADILLRELAGAWPASSERDEG